VAKNKKDISSTRKDTKAEILNMWFSRIRRGEQRRDDIIKEMGGFDYQDAFRGKMMKFIDAQSIDRDMRIPAVNLLWAMVKTEIPALNIKSPHFEVHARKGSSSLSAKIRELALNYEWRHKRMKRQIDKSLQDVFLIGHTWFKTGFTGKFGAIEDGNGYVQEYIKSQDFFGYYVSWKDIVFNPESVDPPHDCRWIAHRFFRPIEDVKANENYSASAREQIQGDVLEDTLVDKDNNMDSFTRWAKLYEIWDIVEEKVFVIAEGVDEFMEAPKEFPYKMRGFPFSFLSFNQINDEQYPVPEAAMWIDQIINHIKIRFQQLDHLKRANRQYEVPKGHLDPEAKKNLSLGLTGSVHEVNGQPGLINLIGSPNVPVDSYTIEQRNLDDLFKISSITPTDLGTAGKTSTRTIGEIIEQQRGSRNRRSDKVDSLNEFMRDIGRNELSLIMQFATQPYYVELTGKEPPELLEQLSLRQSAQDPEAITEAAGFTFTKKDIQGEFDVEIKPGENLELDRATKLELLPKIVQTAIPLLQQGGPVAAAVGRLFAEELDWPELEAAINAEIQFRQQQQQQAQEQLQQQQQMQAAQFGAEKQLEAEKIQSKNTGDLVKFASTVVNAKGGDNGKKGVSN